MVKAGVKASQGSFLKYNAFGFSIDDSPQARHSILGLLYSQECQGDRSFPTYRIHRNICSGLVESSNHQLSTHHLSHSRTHPSWLTHTPAQGFTVDCASVVCEPVN